jgi:hypothetical protein
MLHAVGSARARRSTVVHDSRPSADGPWLNFFNHGQYAAAACPPYLPDGRFSAQILRFC